MTKRILLLLTTMLVLLLGGAPTWRRASLTLLRCSPYVSEWGVPRAGHGELLNWAKSRVFFGF